MSFLEALADQISSQFSLGENSNHTLDAVIDGQNQKYGSLGDYAQQFDQSAERRYVEEGYLRRDPYNTDSKRFEILVQEPNATVLVKKRMFSSIAENFRPDYMDKDEFLYYKATKILFANKCRQISAIEKLSKIQKVTSVVGDIDNQLVPIIITLADTLRDGLGTDGAFGNLAGGSPLSGEPSNFNKVIDRLRKVYGLNTAANYTSWITDSSNVFNTQYGQGTGVIELTNFSNITTNISVDIKNPGTFSFNIIDPYQFMLITEYDIERAIADASNSFYNHKTYQFGVKSANEIIANAQNQLNKTRNARGASLITFKVNPDTLLGKRVTAIIDRTGTEIIFSYDSSGGTGFPGLGGAGNSVVVNNEYLINGSVAGFDGLDTENNVRLGSDSNIKKLFPESEYSIFKRLVASIFNKISLEANSKNAFQTTNKETNYARRKMRFNFSGQSIVQPMDTVHIYMSSKSRFDAKLMTGVSNMFSGVGILQNINKTVTDFKNSFDTLFNPSGSVPLQAEKAVYVGADFPNYLWSLIRSQFVTEKEGTHVFAGVVENVQDDFQPGKFGVTVSGRDNTAYFDQGKVNFKPGVDAFNGYFFDPLTPYKSEFDSISSNTKSKTPELLNENKFLLGSDSFIKFKLGPFAGEQAREDNHLMNSSFDQTTGRNFKTFYAPDGLVYKWKEGIGIFTQFGSSQELNGTNKTGNPNLFLEPFAGLDVMNVLSLLVTGTPYNFATYFRVTQNVNGFNGDQQSAQNSAHSYFGSLNSDLSKRNSLWGNFIPFKNLIIDEQSYIKAITAQSRLVSQNNELEAKLEKLSDLNRHAILFGAVNVLSPQNQQVFDPDLAKIEATKAVLQADIDSTISSIKKQDTDFYQQFGVDSSFDISQFIDSDKKNASVSNPAIRKYLRRQINYLTRRMSYDVRANEDKNFFIVDDAYDKDYDLMAYNQALTDGIKLYNNEFTSVREKIALTAGLLNLEVFADTQGHIRVRPAQYNRMPSSVFYRMMYLKQSLGIQIFPQFMDDFFGSQIDTLKTRIEVLEDQIRLDSAILANLLGYEISLNNDIYAIRVIMNNNTLSGHGSDFGFISSSDGEITDINKLVHQANPKDDPNQELVIFESNLGAQATSNKIAFSSSQRFTTINEILQKQNLDKSGISTGVAPLQTSVVNSLMDRIERKSGQKLSPQDYIVINDSVKNIDLAAKKTVDIFKVTKDLGEKIQERQSAIKLFYSVIKNVMEFRSLDADDSTGNAMLMPGNFGNSHIPEVFEHMIEDETYDDYGTGSGKRFVIKRSQIRNLSIGINSPPYTAVEVQGVQNTFNPTALPPELNSFPAGGNGVVTALAVDYDMWRNFGFKELAPIKVPFLSDPNSQCGPYASMLLSMARKNILRGTLVISGNEFMQPGEVIFLEDRGMLFYVNSVKHNMTMGSVFTTSLELTYGHTAGEYIPTVLDIIGKLIYKNKDSAEIVVQRQERSANESDMGVVQRYKANSTVSEIDGRILGQSNVDFDKGEADKEYSQLFQPADLNTINNVLYNSAYIINSNGTKGHSTKAKIELRVYYDDNNAVNEDTIKLAEIVKEILIDGRAELTKILNQKNSKTPALPPKNADGSETVEVVKINLSDINEKRSPSQKAINIARMNVGNVSGTEVSININTGNPEVTKTSDNTKIKQALYKYVIDIWMSIEQVPDNEINGGV